LSSGVPKRSVDVYLDFISPYSWLALHAARPFAERFAIDWAVRPVVYGVLLNANGLVGPVETPVKRRYTFHDVARLAQHIGLEFTGPPAHPFLSLGALRTMWIFRNDARALDLAVGLADAAWRAGRDLQDPEVLADVTSSAGLDASGLAERIQQLEVKQGLKDETTHALERGVFGVPTFVLDEELFWGHDRLTDLGRRLSGERFTLGAEVDSMIARPVGVHRRKT
jgi:2-hydroxychromene-2-carboxylate isomerase